MAPALCGSFLVDRRSLVAFTWTITTVLTIVAFITAVALMVHVHTHYMRLEHYYEQQYEYNMQQYQNNHEGGEGEGHEGQGQNSADQAELEYYLELSTMHSRSMTFVAAYTVVMAVALNLYGTTAIVGFTSLQGVYIAPCFSSSANPRLRLGIFGGAVIFFANLLLLCAVIFGEVRVEDWSEHRDRNEQNQQQGEQQREPYEIERIAAILAITCMFLSAMYTIFAILLFLYAGTDEESLDEDAVVTHHGKPSLPSFASPGDRTDPRRESFIVGRA